MKGGNKAQFRASPQPSRGHWQIFSMYGQRGSQRLHIWETWGNITHRTATCSLRHPWLSGKCSFTIPTKLFKNTKTYSIHSGWLTSMTLMSLMFKNFLMSAEDKVFVAVETYTFIKTTTNSSHICTCNLFIYLIRVTWDTQEYFISMMVLIHDHSQVAGLPSIKPPNRKPAEEECSWVTVLIRRQGRHFTHSYAEPQ